MTSSLLLPTGEVPSNLHLDPSVRRRFVDNDVFHICDRIAEVSRRLFIEEFVDGDKRSYAIMEMCDDGVARLVFKTKVLDARVVSKVQYLLNVPFEKRFAEAERTEQEAEAARKDAELDALYERVGRPMLTELERCGFVDRPVSYPKRGVTASSTNRKGASDA